MTHLREVTKLTCIVVFVYISSLTQFVDFLSLFLSVNSIGLNGAVDTSVDFEPIYPGFESR